MKFHKVNKEIFVIEDLIPSEICQNYIRLSEELGYEEAKLQIGKTRIRSEGVRNNLSIFHDDLSLANALWELCKDYIPPNTAYGKPIGLNEKFRFYKYEPGMQFKPHRDGVVSKSASCHSYYTFMIYLNEDCEGGETRFERFSMEPKTGAALIFAHNLLHEGAEVLKGVKYVLRTDVMCDIA